MYKIISILLILTVFNSCNNHEFNPSDQQDIAIPVVTTSFKGTTFPVIFLAAFEPGTKVSQGELAFSFYKYEIGNIKIQSGKIIAWDPNYLQEAITFTQVFPKGEFPVHLAMAKTHNDERVAFSRIVFSDSPVIKWELALLPGEVPLALTDSNYYCYGVDAGTGLFIDSIANTYFQKKNRSEWDHVFITKAEQNGYKGYIHSFEVYNLATFSTGYGDGCYATYIGLDKQGNVCQLLTDFELVDWRERE